MAVAQENNSVSPNEIRITLLGTASGPRVHVGKGGISTLVSVVGPEVEITPDPNFIGTPTPVLPLHADLVRAYANAIHRVHGPDMPIIPRMETGTSDASFFRAAGLPVYSADGTWIIVPDDQRAHGLDERLPVRALYDNVIHWEVMVRELAQ